MTSSHLNDSAAASVEHPVTVVYLAYGPPRLVRCTAFSALTLMHAAGDLRRPWRLAIYTDKPAIFEQYGIDADLISLASLSIYANGPGYPHRSKILALGDAAAKYDGALFYADGDTYFSKSPENSFALLASDRSIMYENEFVMSDGHTVVYEREGGDGRGEKLDLLHTIQSSDFKSRALLAAQARPGLPMWNAGVIGLADTNKHLIAEVLTVSDELYAVYGYHICEQLAWSLVLARVGELVPVTDLLHHYWRGKEEVTHRVVRFLHRNRRLEPDDLAAAAYALRPVESDTWEAPMTVRARVMARRLRNRVLSSRLMRTGVSSARTN